MSRLPLAIVTGANSGIGLAIARKLAALGRYNLILGCRNAASAASVLARLSAEYPCAIIDFIPLDLSCPNSIRQFCATVNARAAACCMTPSGEEESGEVCHKDRHCEVSNARAKAAAAATDTASAASDYFATRTTPSKQQQGQQQQWLEVLILNAGIADFHGPRRAASIAADFNTSTSTSTTRTRTYDAVDGGSHGDDVTEGGREEDSNAHENATIESPTTSCSSSFAAYEATMATNHLGHYLLARLLAPLFFAGADHGSRIATTTSPDVTVATKNQTGTTEGSRKSYVNQGHREEEEGGGGHVCEKTRVVTVSSSLHNVPHGLDVLDFERHGCTPTVPTQTADHAGRNGPPVPFDGREAYRASKLANVLFAAELARRHPQICSYSASPGLVPTTGLFRAAGPLGAAFMRYGMGWLLRPLMGGKIRTVEEGAECMIQLVLGGAPGGARDGYWRTSNEGVLEPGQLSEQAQDMDLAQQLWDKSARAVGLDN